MNLSTVSDELIEVEYQHRQKLKRINQQQEELRLSAEKEANSKQELVKAESQLLALLTKFGWERKKNKFILPKVTFDDGDKYVFSFGLGYEDEITLNVDDLKMTCKTIASKVLEQIYTEYEIWDDYVPDSFKNKTGLQKQLDQLNTWDSEYQYETVNTLISKYF